MADDYRRAYEVAAAELEDFLRQQERLEEQIVSRRKTLNVLSELIQQQEGSSDFTDHANARLRNILDTSITDDVQQIVSLSRKPLTTTEIKNELTEMGSLLIQHSNPLATINAVLNRLKERKRVKETVNKDGKKAWVRVLPERFKPRF